MSAPHIILDNLPSLCQKLSDLVEVCRSYNKNDFACFFETRCRISLNTILMNFAVTGEHQREDIYLFRICYTHLDCKLYKKW